jgi:glyoxylase-like metal-dependent hydrolase (beta-lactamase superfamily II)
MNRAVLEAWLRSIREEVEKSPPVGVVPAHGDAVVEETARRTSELLRIPA